jgi:hypothetical protein
VVSQPMKRVTDKCGAIQRMSPVGGCCVGAPPRRVDLMRSSRLAMSWEDEGWLGYGPQVKRRLPTRRNARCNCARHLPKTFPRICQTI